MSQAYKKWVERLVQATVDKTNLGEWRIDVTFDVEGEDENCVGFTGVDARYMISHIYFTPYARELFEEGKFGTLAECVVHEVCHILLNPLHTFAKQAASPQTESQLTDILEQATQRLARIVKAHLPKNILKV